MPLRLPWVNNIFSMSEQSSQCVTDYRMWLCSTWAVKLRVELWKSLQCYSLHHHYNLIRINNLTGWQIDIWKIKPTKYPSSPSMLVCLVCSVALKKLEMLLKGLIIQIKKVIKEGPSFHMWTADAFFGQAKSFPLYSHLPSLFLYIPNFTEIIVWCYQTIIWGKQKKT